MNRKGNLLQEEKGKHILISHHWKKLRNKLRKMILAQILSLKKREKVESSKEKPKKRKKKNLRSKKEEKGRRKVTTSSSEEGINAISSGEEKMKEYHFKFSFGNSTPGGVLVDPSHSTVSSGDGIVGRSILPGGSKIVRKSTLPGGSEIVNKLKFENDLKVEQKENKTLKTRTFINLVHSGISGKHSQRSTLGKNENKRKGMNIA